MKMPFKSIFTLLLFGQLQISTFSKAVAQDIMYIHYNDGTIQEFQIDGIQKLTFDHTTDARQQAALLETFIKLKAFPNPATDYVTIEYEVPEEGTVSIDFTGINGHRIKTISQGKQHPGRYSFHWNTLDLAPGIYICRINQNNSIISEKIIINK